MSMDAPNKRGNSSSSRAAERMRLHRKRRREGLQLVQIALPATDIEDFIWLGLLEENQRHNPEALQALILELVQRMVDEIRGGMVPVRRPT
jgi:hypothetical protein